MGRDRRRDGASMDLAGRAGPSAASEALSVRRARRAGDAGEGQAASHPVLATRPGRVRAGLAPVADRRNRPPESANTRTRSWPWASGQRPSHWSTGRSHARWATPSCFFCCICRTGRSDFITGYKPTWPGGPTVGLGVYAHPWWDFAGRVGGDRGVLAGVPRSFSARARRSVLMPSSRSASSACRWGSRCCSGPTCARRCGTFRERARFESGRLARGAGSSQVSRSVRRRRLRRHRAPVRRTACLLHSGLRTINPSEHGERRRPPRTGVAGLFDLRQRKVL